MDIKAVARAARDRFALGPWSVHGPDHWQRVKENGLRLARANNADQELIELFALLHDCCRGDDGADMQHGPRAVAYMDSLRGDLLKGLGQARYACLREAVRDHTRGKVSDDPTIGACWDADRLDIGRVKMTVQRRFLSTREAKKESVIKWARQRSRH